MSAAPRSATQPPDTLGELLELWQRRGTLTIDGGHLFQFTSWASLLLGQNLLPETVHPLTARAEPAAIAPRVRHIVDALRRRAAMLPDHAQFVERYSA